MRTTRFMIITAMLGLFLAAAASSDSLVPQMRVTNVVEVRDVNGDAATVSGRLVNLSDRTLSNLKLSVSDTFLWTDERHLGSDDPSQAGTYAVAQEIPPNGSVTFTVQRTTALPTRSDGEFRTKIQVMGLTQKPARVRAYWEPGPYLPRT
jgi:hypothetical protein